MTTDITKTNGVDHGIERVLVDGDLSRMTEEQRVRYTAKVCESLGLNPLTRPFQFLRLSGKTVMYASKDATDQLRKINGVSIVITSRETIDGVYVVTARATDKTGRTDEDVGAIPFGNAKGEMLANLMMKATTKAKRRVTLSICGLGWIDESEVESIPGATRISYDAETGESLDGPILSPEEDARSEEQARIRNESAALVKEWGVMLKHLIDTKDAEGFARWCDLHGHLFDELDTNSRAKAHRQALKAAEILGVSIADAKQWLVESVERKADT